MSRDTYVQTFAVMALVIVPLWWTPGLSAQPCTTPQVSTNWPNLDADGNLDPLPGYTDGDPLYYYVEADFGRELKSCLAHDLDNSSPIRGLTDAAADRQVRNAIIKGAELWNLESRGAVLVYGGTIDAEDADSACALMVKKPAVFVRFEPRCSFNSGSPESCNSISATGVATVEFIQSCDHAVDVIMWGDSDTATNCVGTGVWDWQLDGRNADRDVSGLSNHEFGHVLGIGHPDPAPPGDESRMISSKATNPNVAEVLHLYPYDKDCVESPTAGNHRAQRRAVRYRWQGFNSGGRPAGAVESGDAVLVRGSLSGGFLRTASGPRLARYHDTRLDNTEVDDGGFFVFNRGHPFSRQEIRALQHMPVLMSPLEIRDETHRIHFAARGTLDPPPIQFVGSGSFFHGKSEAGEYAACATAACGFGDRRPIRSHVPLVSAWDAVSSNTVFVSVGTDRGFAGNGEINVYPGFRSTVTHTLRLPRRLSSGRTPPADDYADFSYTLKTDVAPGVACGPDPPERSEYSHNCILAWVDRGIADGRILYTYFRIENDDVVWIDSSPGTWVRGSLSSAVSQTGVSAAYFGGEFWLAWKSIDGEIKYTHTTTSHLEWTRPPTTIPRSGVVEPPSWAYVPHEPKEAVLMWTEVEDGG